MSTTRQNTLLIGEQSMKRFREILAEDKLDKAPFDFLVITDVLKFGDWWTFFAATAEEALAGGKSVLYQLGWGGDYGKVWLEGEAPKPDEDDLYEVLKKVAE